MYATQWKNSNVKIDAKIKGLNINNNDDRFVSMYHEVNSYQMHIKRSYFESHDISVVVTYEAVIH